MRSVRPHYGLRRVALPLFGAGLAWMAVGYAWDLRDMGWAGWMATMPPAGVAGLMAGAALELAVLAYVWSLHRRGVLQ